MQLQCWGLSAALKLCNVPFIYLFLFAIYLFPLYIKMLLVKYVCIIYIVDIAFLSPTCAS